MIRFAFEYSMGLIACTTGHIVLRLFTPHRRRDRASQRRELWDCLDVASYQKWSPHLKEADTEEQLEYGAVL